MKHTTYTLTALKAFLLLVTAAVAFTSSAQSQQGMEILSRFDARFSALDSLIFIAGSEHAPVSTARPDTTVSASRANVDAAIDRRVDAQIGEIRSVTGLKFTGQTYYRLDGMLGSDDEDDPVSVYKAKIQAELRWYPFQSALFKRAGRINEMKIRGAIDKLAYDKEDLGMLVERQKEAFRVYSDSLLSGILLHRIRNLEMLSGAYTYLLGNENISSDDLLQILNEKAEAERLLASIPGVHVPATDLARPSGFIVELDTAAYLAKVRSTQADISTLRLQIELLEQQERNTSYWSEVNAAPFVRYSLYHRTAAPNSSNVDAGLVFTVPLSFEYWKKRKAFRAQRDILEAEREHLSTRILEAVRATLLDIERYNAASLGEYRRMEELKQYLVIRANAYENRVGEYNRLARMKEYNSYIQCCEKFIDYQYRKECAIADLQKFLTDTSVLSFCREIPLESIKSR